MTTAAIDPETRVGLLALTIADLDRSVTFYADAFGFALLQRGDGQATLGAGGVPLLLLKEESGARAFPHDQYGYTGLYHFAILVPTRADLGRWLAHWLETGHPLPGQGDHLVSEALYIVDPDGNGIEIYRDRPRDTWRWQNGQIQMATDPVDLRGVLADAQQEDKPWTGLAGGTRLGHMHLQVGDIKQAVQFYHETLGFDIMAQMPTALFVSAGGYHHHIGMNTWHSRGASPTPPDMAGLRFFTIDFGGEPARAAAVERLSAAGVLYSEVAGDVVLQDPWHNTIVLQIGSATDMASATQLESLPTTA